MKIVIMTAFLAALACALAFQQTGTKANQKLKHSVHNLHQTSPKRADKVVKSDAEWQKILTPEQYKISRKAGTERPFCGVNLESKGPGTYECVACALPLFKAGNKFDSGTGWPSFGEPIDPDHVWYHSDTALGMVRTEILCSRCDGHLGHVFDDGPPPTGLRYCINGTVLKFVPEK